MKTFFGKHCKTLFPFVELLLVAALLCHRPTFLNVLGSLGILFALYGLMLCLSRRIIGSLHAAFTVLLLFFLINEAKRYFWKGRLQFDDWAVLTDPNNFETLLHYPIPAVGAAVLLTLLCWLFVRGVASDRKKIGGVAAAVVGMTLAGIGIGAAYYAQLNGQEAWLKSMPKGSNFIANVLMSANPHYKSPAEYFNLEGAQPFVFESEPQKNADGQLPDVVLLLQESTMDPRYLKGIDPASLPKLDMFDSTHATQSGLLRVHTYGGGTWKSEFAVLTGLSSEDFTPFDNSVFYSAVFHLKDSLFLRMKKAGYKTVIITPFVEGSYNSGQAYRHLGVDEIIHVTERGFPGAPNKNVWKISAEALLDIGRTYLDEQTEPVFLYMLTMDEHGPYEAKDSPGFQIRSEAEGSSNVSRARLYTLENYVERLVEASEAVERFERWVRERSKPTMFLRFGDHQPALNWEEGYRLALPDPAFVTQYALTDNRTDAKENAYPITDIVYLAGMILERIPGCEDGEFFRANRSMRKAAHGGYDDCADPALLKSYRHEIFVRQKVAE